MTPFIEKIRKGPHQKGVSKGQIWVRESLREHKLSMQLKVLVSNEQHMYRHYFGKNNKGQYLCQFWSLLLYEDAKTKIILDKLLVYE